MTLITDVFHKLRTTKNMVRSMPKESRFSVYVEKQHGKGAQLSDKKSLLGICKISARFPNTHSADGNYSPLIETI